MSAFAPRLSDFTGVWQVDRSIRHHDSGSTGHFAGTAELAPVPDGLSYTENGTLTLDHHPPFKAERRYLWQEADDVIHVFFTDGRPFHSFSGCDTEDTHWCDPDTYRVTYDFDDWPIWRSIWHVSGPKKAYEMITTYRGT